MEGMENFLSNLPLFKSFSSTELKKLIEKSEAKRFAPQEKIIHFGQPGRFLGIVVEGEAEAVVTGEMGIRQRLGLLRRGDFLGEMSLLTGEPTSADVIALEECQILLIPQEIFSIFIAVNSDAVKIMAKTITERLKSRQNDEKAQARLEDARRMVPDPYSLQLSTSAPMKILVINCGSSSLKYNYFDTAEKMNNSDGIVERIGLENPRIISSSRKAKITKELISIDYRDAFKAVIDLLTDSGSSFVRDLKELTAIGHRVVHGGDKYGSAAIIDEEVISQIDKNSVLAPLHNPLNLLMIKESMKFLPEVPQVAVFDTGFHQKMPLHAYLYGLPYEFYEKDRIRRYGFHGISHNYVALQAATYLRRNFWGMKMITCHLGNGASLCAVDHGHSVDTSMGMTPLEGLIMGTRCGDLDPSVVLYLLKEKGLTIEELDGILNRQSGLKGLSGITSDFRMLEEASNKGNQRALTAIHAFCYRIRKYIGAYIAAMGGLDTLIFTGGIGENSAWVRSLACQGLSYLGIQVDDIHNRTVKPCSGEVSDISDERSRVKILVIPTDEGRMIARETIRILGQQIVAQVINKQKEKSIPIEVSAHHIHLSRKEIDRLFGTGYELTARSSLSQPGQYACEEAVNLIGPKGRVENLRVLGPLRSQTQVEISRTEEFKLGIKAPIRPSGDLEGSPGITLEGPKGTCDIPYGVICALRHIHMSPEDALSFGLKDRDVVMVKVKGQRTLIFGDILIRISPDFLTSMHVDTDEANAASLSAGMEGYIVGVEDRR
jgi:acetate kinase